MAEKQKEPRETLKVKSLEFLFSTGIFKGQPVTRLHRARAHGGHRLPAERGRTGATAYPPTVKLQSLPGFP